MIGVKVTYSKRTTGSLKYKAEKSIVNAIESSPAMRKEIRRVFHAANQRIQRLENAGVISPALLGLGERGSRYSKFSMTGISWDNLRVEYGRAVAFLQQPTSTLSGARELERQMMTYGGYDDATWERLRPELISGYSEDIDPIFEKAPYEETMKMLYSRVERTRSRMEYDARNNEDMLQRQINEQAAKVASDIDDYINSFGIGYENL